MTMAASKGLSLRAVAAVCAFVGALVYVNTLDCGLCFDDTAAIEDNMDLRPNTPWTNLLWNDFWGLPMNDKDSHKSYRPLCVATFRLNYLIHELQPMGYHLVNVLLHSAVCYLYVLLCGVIFGDVWPALIAGLLFAVHPIHTEAVGGLVGRADVVGSVFFLGAFLSYRRMVLSSKPQGYKWLALALFLCLCSALSKETGITVVALCLTYEFFILHKMDLQSSVKLLKTLFSQPNKLPKWFWQFVVHVGILAMFTVTFLVLRVRLNEGPPTFSMLNNPAMTFNTPFRQLHWSYLCFLNLWLLFNPGKLVAESSMGTVPPIATLADPRNLLTITTFISVIFLALYSLRRSEKQRRIVLFGLSLMIFPFIPASNLFFPVGFVIAERVLYIPSMGFTMVVGYGAWLVLNRVNRGVLKNFFLFGLIYVLAVHATKAVLRNRDWYSSLSLYSSAVRTTPGNGKMFNNLATVYDRRGNRSLAEELFKLSTVIEPDYITGYMNLAFVMKDQERYEEAIEVYKDAASLVSRGLFGEHVHITPKNVRVYSVLADLLNEHTGELEEALRYSLKATEAEPQYEGGHNNKGYILLKLERFQQAKEALEEAIRLNNSFAIAHSNLGEVYRKLDDHLNAEKYFRKALSLDSDNILTKFRLAGMVISGSRSRSVEKLLEAEKLLLDVLSIEPENGNATFTLALVYYDLKNYSKAEEMFLRTVEITPGDQGALYNLGVMLTGLERYPEAIPHLQRLVELYPNHLGGAAQMGTCYMQMNEKQRAREIFEGVLLKDPTQTSVLNNLGVLMIHMKEIDEAIRLFTEVIKLEPDNEATKNQLTELYKYKQRTATGSPSIPREPTKPTN